MARTALIAFHNETCIGLRYLKGHLRERGHETTLVNLKVYSKDAVDSVPEDPRYTEVHIVLEPDGWYYYSYPWQPTDREWELFVGRIVQSDPQLIGMTVTASHLRTASEAARRLREACPGVPIVWGGAQPTIDPEGSLEHADYVCMGEGEQSLAAIAAAVDMDEPFDEINNLAFKRPDGTLVKNPLFPTINDLDSLPFQDYDPESCYYVEGDEIYQGEFPPESKHRSSFMIITARGCPYVCSFCINAVTNDMYKGNPRVRRRSVENVIEELRWVKQTFGDVYIQIEDEIFTMDRTWIKEFSEVYKREIHLPFWCYTHPGCCQEEMVRDLRDAGLRFIVMGIQSGSDRLNREVYHRPLPRRKILETLNLLDSLDIVTTCDLLTNNPLETDEDRKQTVDLMRQLPKRIQLGMGKLVVYPNSPVHEVMKDVPYPYSVDEELYRYWNSLYLIALYDHCDDSEWEDLLDGPFVGEKLDALEHRALALLKQTYDLTEERLESREVEVRRELEKMRVAAGGASADESVNPVPPEDTRRVKRWIRNVLGGVRQSMS